MAPESGDDRRLDGPLRDALRGQSVTGGCVDAETLAAWSDGTLTAVAQDAVDSHLSTCSRCRAMAATLADLRETAAAPAVVPFARRSVQWKTVMISAGALAASVLIVVLVRDGSPAPQSTVADGVNSAKTAPADPLRDAQPLLTPEAPARGALSPEAGQALQDRRGRGQTNAVNRPAQGATAPRTAEPDAARPAATLPAAAPPQPAPPPPPPAVLPVTPAQQRTTTPAAIDPARLPDLRADALAPLPPPPLIAEFVAGDNSRQLESNRFRAADRTAAATGGAGRGGAGAGTTGGRAAGTTATSGAPVVQTAPAAEAAVSNVPVRWRLRGPVQPPRASGVNLFERSTNGGKTWLPLTLDPETPLLLAGSAPSNTVCWLAGKEGRVLLSDDGATFRRVAQPVNADLVFIDATDARTATVRTADGRTFVTSNGGATWSAR